MPSRLTLALVGDRDERITAHRAIEAALPLAARSLGVALVLALARSALAAAR